MKTYNDLRSELQVNEAVEYRYEPTRVIAKLTSYDSGPYTRLARNIKKVKELEDEIAVAKEAIKADTREHVAALFKAEDAIMTRVVETVSLVMTLSKDPKPTETVKYAKVIDEISKELTPELLARLNELKKEYTSIVQKMPSLTISEGKVADMWKKIKAGAKSFFDKIKSWGSSYDKKLASIKAKAKAIKS